jgi:CHAT domain-containing protein
MLRTAKRLLTVHQETSKRRLRFSPSSAILPVLVVLFLCSCSHRHDPQSAFEHARQTLRRGELAAAASEAEKGYENFHRMSAEWACKFTILRAAALSGEGKNNEVLKLLASDGAQCAPGELLVKKLRLEAQAYISLHRFSEAEHSLTQAEDACSTTDYPTCADVTSARGTLEMNRGRYRQAELLFARVVPKARASGNRFWEASALLDLAWSADEQAHFDQALDLSSAALEISETQAFPDLSQAALGDMGWAYYKLGDSEKALEMFAEAKDQAEKLGDLGDEVKWLTNAGYVDMDAGELLKAEQSFQQSLDLARKINSQEDIVNSLMSLAFVYEQTGKLDDAKRYADEALAMARKDENGRDVVYPLLVEGRVAAHKHDIATAEADFNEVAKSADTPVFLKWEAERSLARLYEDENQPTAADAEYRTALTTFEAARCDLHQRVDSRLPFLSNAARIYEDYIHFLVERGKINDALRVADYTRARTLAEGLGRACKPTFAPDALNAPEIAHRAGGTILFYALGQDHSYSWVITPNRVKLFPLTANQSEIDAAVQRYRKQLEGPPEILESSNDGSVLYQMLVAPAQDLLNQEALAEKKNNNIFIISDGGLNSLNFETLTPQPNHYWIEDVTIANAPSLRLLPASRRSSANLAGKLLLIGNPITPDAGADNSYPELPNAAAQMVNIEKYFPVEQQTVFSRVQASPPAYLANHPEQFSYIHFVAHGTASRLNPLDSAIILSREPAANAATTEDDSFKLYARDIIGTRRLRAELVTISACYSTGKRTYSGEGLVGLSWAFLRAGAHNVIAALWDVSDVSTPQLVDEFYAELKKGKSPAVALRSAKLTLLHGAFHSPFYWAPFQLYSGS